MNGATVETYPPRQRVEIVRDGEIKVPTQKVETPETAAMIMRIHLGRVADEHLVVLLLDTQHMLIGTQTVGVGTIASCPASTKNVIRAAILSNAAGIIVGHNHPSGNPRATGDDIKFFKRLKTACEIFDDIRLLDAIIIGDGTDQVYSHGSQTYDLR